MDVVSQEVHGQRALAREQIETHGNRCGAPGGQEVVTKRHRVGKGNQGERFGSDSPAIVIVGEELERSEDTSS